MCKVGEIIMNYVKNIESANKLTPPFNKIRNSRIELLRIISMLLIVIHHFAVHGFEGINSENFNFVFSPNLIFLQFQTIMGKIGVDLFFIISAWFMVDKKIDYKRFIKLFGEVWFYSILIMLLFLFILEPVEPIKIKKIIGNFLPVLTGQYWFVTTYVILIFFSPFLNKIIEKFNKKELKDFIILLFIMIVIINGIFGKFFKDLRNNVISVIFIYLFVGYIKKNIIFDNNYKRNLLLSLVSLLLYLFNVFIIDLVAHTLGDKISLYKRASYFGKNSLSVFTIITSIELFIAFIKMEPFENKFINKIASATFGIYLIHDNQIFRRYLWDKIFRVNTFYSSKYLILYAIAVTLVIYVTCTIIDLLRQATIEKLWLKIGNHLYNIMKNVIQWFCTKLIYVIKRFKALE